MSNDYLAHFNPNHDPTNGQFTSNNISGISQTTDISKKFNFSSVLRDERRSHLFDNGVKNQVNASKLTDEQKRKLKIATVAAITAVGVTAGIYIAYRLHATDKIGGLLASGVTNKQRFKDAMLEALDNETYILKKGTEIHRMEAFKNLDITKKDDLAYASFKKGDIATYMTMLRDWSGTGQRFDAKYEAIKDLKIPTKEKARKIFETLWNENPQYQQELQSTIIQTAKKLHPFGNLISDQKALDIMNKEIGRDKFDHAMYALVRKGGDSKILSKALVSAGYDAIEDYFDKGVMAKSPIILLSPKDSVVKTGEQFVDKMLKIQALKNALVVGDKTLLPQSPIPTKTVMTMVRLGMLP